MPCLRARTEVWHGGHHWGGDKVARQFHCNGWAKRRSGIGEMTGRLALFLVGIVLAWAGVGLLLLVIWKLVIPWLSR